MDEIIPDFLNACERADEILLCSDNISSFPFSMHRVVDEFSEVVQKPYSSINKDNFLSVSQIVGSEDGAIITDGNGHYILFYNELMPQTRLRFTYGHELGHIMLDHDIKLISLYSKDEDSRFRALNEKYEAEANMFAAELLMPEPIISELLRRGCILSEKFLENTFHVSNHAAKVRLRYIRRSYTNSSKARDFAIGHGHSYDDLLLQKFKPFIDIIAPRTISYIDEYELELAKEEERQSWY